MHARSASQTHMLCLERAKSTWKSEWASKAYRQAHEWAPCLASLHSSVDRGTSLWSLHPFEGTHTLCSHMPSGQMMMGAQRWPGNSTVPAWTCDPDAINNYCLTSSCNSDECVTRPTRCKNNPPPPPPCSKEVENFSSNQRRVSWKSREKNWLKHGCISNCWAVNSPTIIRVVFYL